ncbi:MAG TPA: ABC transporter ATP-binding protein, partial [Aquificaceae bacterium]|nr:ABC transporter ATP-binding protein [Aquificaceae bacterium]
GSPTNFSSIDSGIGPTKAAKTGTSLDRPIRGFVFFQGREVDFTKERELSDIRNRKIGFVFQFHYLLPEFSAVENVMIPMLKRGVPKDEGKERAMALLSLVGLAGKEDRRPYQLSGGEQQRVAIARALANDPLLLLADEPTGNLDSKNSELVMDIFLRLNEEGRTIVMVTHEEELAEKTERTLRMKDGRIIL